MSRDASYWIERLGLTEHPEGGFYRETYRAGRSIPGASREHPAGRCFSTAIYYLLRSGEVSRLHRLRSDELFHHYAGSPLVVHLLHADGRHEPIKVGDDPGRGQLPQTVVPAGTWFGATVEAADSYALVGCTVAPGFELADFELAERELMLRRFPRQRDLIELLT